MKISAIIVVKNDDMALWHTFNSVFAQLKEYDDFEIIIIDDDSDSFTLKEYFGRRNFDSRVRYERVSFNTPSDARNYGANIATGDLLLFLDSHVILGDNTVGKVIEFFNNHKTAMIGFIPLIRYPGSSLESHHHIHWDKDLYFDWLGPKNESFKCASGGHGAFAVRKYWWDKLGGYFNGLNGYSVAEEVYLNTFSWMNGGENWVISNVYQIHNDWGRTYKQNQDLIRSNHLMVAYILGGDKYFNIVRYNYAPNFDENFYNNLKILLKDARQKVINTGVNLDDLLNKFKVENIDY